MTSRIASKASLRGTRLESKSHLILPRGGKHELSKGFLLKFRLIKKQLVQRILRGAESSLREHLFRRNPSETGFGISSGNIPPEGVERELSNRC